LQAMDDAAIDVTIVHAEDLGPSAPIQPLPHAYWAGVRADCRERVRVLASVHPMRGSQGIADLRSGFREGLYAGLFNSPFQQGVRISAGDYDEIFRCCADEGIPVWVHCGMHWDRAHSLDEDRPSVIDNLCVKFPELRVIAGHGGWPWMLEMCALAWKHRNLYLEISAHRPRHLLRAGSGWEPLFNFGTGVIKDKILLGTASFLLGMSPSEVLEEFKALNVPGDVLTRWLGINALSVYGLTPRP
jgi:predicted TIM-barrel fold metal-dependent hydrolase